MFGCPYCGQEQPEELNFCAKCEQQVRCLDCRAALIAEKSRCLVCGVPIKNGSGHSVSMSEYSLEEAQTNRSSRRSIRLRFSDSAILAAAPFITGIASISKPVTRNTVTVRSADQPMLPAFEDTANHAVPEEAQEDVGTIEAGGGAQQSGFSKFFERDGDRRINPLVPDYRGRTKKDQQERFILMYCGAYSDLLGVPVPDRDTINDAAKVAGLFDPNFGKYFTKLSKRFLTQGEGGFRLNPPGRAETLKIMAEMEDSEKTRAAYWDGSSRPSRKRAAVNKEDREMIESWVATNIDLGKLDVRRLSTPSAQAMFSVWAITKRLNAVSAVKPAAAFIYLTTKFATVPAKAKSFSDAFSRPTNAKRFAKNADGAYYLTETAEKDVEGWVNSGAVELGEVDGRLGSEEGDVN